MEKLLEYHITETNRRFDEVKSELRDVKTDVKEVSNQLQDLGKFKAQMVGAATGSARTIAFVVSGAWSVLTLLASIYLSKKG